VRFKVFAGSKQKHNDCVSSALDRHRINRLQEAAQIAIGKIGKLGGVVGIDKNGNIMHFYNTEGMYRGRVGVEGKMIIEIYEK
jgi:beta-aspartyl-peptidase (threonine type)